MRGVGGVGVKKSEPNSNGIFWGGKIWLQAPRAPIGSCAVSGSGIYRTCDITIWSSGLRMDFPPANLHNTTKFKTLTRRRYDTYYLPRDFWPSSVNQKTISDFWDLNPGPNSLLAIVASLRHLPATSVKSHKYYKFQPTCRRAHTAMPPLIFAPTN